MPIYTLEGNGPAKSYESEKQVAVDFKKLRCSGELSDEDCRLLENDYSGSPILFMGMVEHGLVQRFAIAICVNGVIYPKNIFWISPALAYEAVT